jgi:ferrous iron transport protein A
MESKLKCFNDFSPAAPAHGMPLAIVQAGRRVRLTGIVAGHGLKSRLAAMGLIPGVEMKVVRNSPNGPFLVEVMGSRIMLGRGMTLKILVE